MNNQSTITNTLDTAQLDLLNKLLTSLNNEQKIWLGGYLSGINQSTGSLLQILAQDQSLISLAQPTSTVGLKILFGTRSGNAQKIAQIAKRQSEALGVNCTLVSLNDYNPKELKKEKNLLIIISTDGEGEPPVSAEEFYNYLHSKKAPALKELKYGVISLGDSSYQHFCKIGKDVDTRINELGGESFYDRIDLDLDFEEPATEWIESAITKFAEENKADTPVQANVGAGISTASSTVTKEAPYKAPILDKILLNGKGSGKETYHYEFSIEESGIQYTPGDSLGVYSSNDSRLVDKVLELTKVNEKDKIVVGKDEKTIREALTNNYELTRLTPPLVKSYAELAKSSKLDKLIGNTKDFEKFLWGRDVIDLLEEYPVSFDNKTLFGTLRKLQPRLYSIASSYNDNPDEVHVTVASVKYQNSGRNRFGVCSTFLSDRIDPDEVEVPIYIDENIGFRLPNDPNIPIIMIGAGTGVAPYRAFLQEREFSGSTGKNWLFFGDRNFNTDFLYQTEWQKFHKKGLLNNIDVAFSRDQKEKIYVQDKLLSQQKDVFKWIEEGAHVYICGDKDNMAKDVKDTFVKIIKDVGGFKKDKAEEYFKQLRRDNRFQEDVY